MLTKNKRIKELEKEKFDVRRKLVDMHKKLEEHSNTLTSHNDRIQGLVRESQCPESPKYSWPNDPPRSELKPSFPVTQILEALLDELGLKCEKLPASILKVKFTKKD